jgi:hypothetical protein
MEESVLNIFSNEIIAQILSHLDHPSSVSAAKACKLFYELIKPERALFLKKRLRTIQKNTGLRRLLKRSLGCRHPIDWIETILDSYGDPALWEGSINTFIFSIPLRKRKIIREGLEAVRPQCDDWGYAQQLLQVAMKRKIVCARTMLARTKMLHLLLLGGTEMFRAALKEYASTTNGDEWDIHSMNSIRHDEIALFIGMCVQDVSLMREYIETAINNQSDSIRFMAQIPSLKGSQRIQLRRDFCMKHRSIILECAKVLFKLNRVMPVSLLLELNKDEKQKNYDDAIGVVTEAETYAVHLLWNLEFWSQMASRALKLLMRGSNIEWIKGTIRRVKESIPQRQTYSVALSFYTKSVRYLSERFISTMVAAPNQLFDELFYLGIAIIEGTQIVLSPESMSEIVVWSTVNECLFEKIVAYFLEHKEYMENLWFTWIISSCPGYKIDLLLSSSLFQQNIDKWYPQEQWSLSKYKDQIVERHAKRRKIEQQQQQPTVS